MRFKFLTLGFWLVSCIHVGSSRPSPLLGLYFKVKVGRSHTLDQIATTFQVPAARIQYANQLNSRRYLQPGSILFIPVSTYALKSPRIRKNFPLYNVSSSGTHGAIVYQSNNSLIWPVDGIVTWGYGERSGRLHQGIDISADQGTPIRSAKSGTVDFAGWQSGYGWTVIVNHNSFKTLYAHCSKILVRKNQTVRQGLLLGLVGSSGNAEGSHLHFEYRNGLNASVDPLTRLPVDYSH